MRSKHFLGLLLVAGTAVAAVSSGCGGDVETGAGGNGGEGGTDTTTTTGTTMTTGTSMTTGTGGTGGMGGMGACADDKDGNCDFDTAEEIEFNAESLAADLEPVDQDEDFYTFEGKAGQALFIYTDAKPADDEYSKEYADLVITLYDESGKRVAENDDPTASRSNDSELYTILPADGKYYLRVEECSTWAAQNNFPDTSCAPAGDILNTGYELSILELDPAFPFVTIEDKAMDIADPASAAALKYAPSMTPGLYIPSMAAGFYTDAMDKDYYSFKIPVDDPATPGGEGIKLTAAERLVGYFDFLPGGNPAAMAPGDVANGSTAPLGLISIVDPMTMTTVAQVDGQLSFDMAPPLEVGKEYLLQVSAPASGGDFAGNPFYFVLHSGGGSNPVEKELTAGQPPNNTALTAETLVQVMSQPSYFVDGDITAAPADLDYFKVSVPQGLKLVSLVCGSQRSGSGLTGFKATILGPDGTTTVKTGTETAKDELFLPQIPVPNGATELYVKLEAAGQNPMVTSSFYRCGIHFSM